MNINKKELISDLIKFIVIYVLASSVLAYQYGGEILNGDSMLLLYYLIAGVLIYHIGKGLVMPN